MKKFKSYILFLMCSFLLGCGKEVAEVKNANLEQTQQLDSSSFTLHYEHLPFNSFHRIIPRNANFKLLDKFPFQSDVPLTHALAIFFNATQVPFAFEFKCIYTPNNSTQQFELARCLNSVENNLGSVIGIDFMLDKDKRIVIQSQETQVFETQVNFQVEWK